MNKLVLVLAATTVASAAAALHYRHQLIEERAAHVVVVRPVAEQRAAASAAVATPVSTAAPEPEKAAPANKPAPSTQAAATASPAVASRPPLRPIDPDRKARMRGQSEEFLKKLEDPTQHAVLLEQSRERVKRQFQDFAREKNLDPAKFDQLVETVAQMDLDIREAQSRCIVDPACTSPPGFREYQAQQEEKLTALLGNDDFQDFKNWAETQVERRAIKGFASRLPSNAALSPQQSQALISALRQGRQSIQQEMSAGGTHFTGYGNQDGLFVLYQDQVGSIDASMASAQAYNQRMRDHAATVISGEQLTVFNQMQEELLFDLQRQLRRKEKEKSEGGS